jgi:uncharacterized protein
VLRSSKDRIFYQLLDQQAEVAIRAAEGFLEMVRNPADLASHAQKMEDIEHEGDTLTHELQNKIAATFITPIDQEDLSALSHGLDDVTDYVEAVAARLELYHLSDMRPDVAPMAELVVQIARLTRDAVKELGGNWKKSKTLKDTLRNMHTVENESDRLFRTALRGLFDQQGIDALSVIKWKEVYDRIEAAVDRCEDLAKIIENLTVKYA